MDKREMFGKKVRERRLEKDIGLRELARRVGIDYSRLSRIERGKRPPPELEVIVKIAEILGLPQNELLALSGVPERIIGEGDGDHSGGIENWIRGVVTGQDRNMTLVQAGNWMFRIITDVGTEQVLVGLRPEDITLFVTDNSFSATSARNQLKGTVKDIESKGKYHWVTLDCTDFDLIVAITNTSLSKLDLTAGKTVYATFKATAPVVKGRED